MPKIDNDFRKNGVAVEKKDGNFTVFITKPVKIEISETKGNKKVLIILLRSIKNFKNKEILTYKYISKALGLNNRQDSNNFWREFIEFGKDINDFLQRKRKYSDADSIIEKQVLSAPLLSIKEHHIAFCRSNPEFAKMSYPTFVKYYNDISTSKFMHKAKDCLIKGKSNIDAVKLVSEVLDETDSSKLKRKQIVDLFPEVEKEDKQEITRASFLMNINAFSKYLLTMIMIAFGLNYNALSLLFGVSKATISNYFHKLSFMKELIIRSIIRWSGEISVDEKWIKINGKWHYILSIVDNKTNFLLYFNVVSDLSSDTWKLFFQRFYHLYGIPNLIVSDGSQSLAAARKFVFPDVKHQLCKFHKYKNLLNRIYKMYNGQSKDRCFRLAKGIFCNTTYYGRKRAARQLVAMDIPKVSCYVKNNILTNWKYLTKCMTSNASERWNRKIEKAISKRYGLKSVKFVNQLITSLWLKEALNNKQHFEKCFINDIDLSRICQENMKVCNIIDMIKRKLLEESA